jgi:hypothetical protein
MRESEEMFSSEEVYSSYLRVDEKVKKVQRR